MHERTKPLVYIAADFTRKDEAKALKTLCEGMGFGVLSSWHRERDVRVLEDLTVEDAAEMALRDIEEVSHCDVFLMLSSPGDCGLVLLGVAIECDIPVVVYGVTHSIYQYLPQVTVACDDEQLRESLMSAVTGTSDTQDTL